MSGWLAPPNLVTAARIGLTPFIGLAVARDDFPLAFPLFLAAALSDLADGWLARRFHWTSRAGAILDPIADKLLAATIFLALAVSGAIPAWFAALVLARDLFILAFAAWALAFRKIRDFPPRVWGKISTFFQFSAAAGAVIARTWPSFPALVLYPTVFWCAVLATLLSGADYFLAARRMLGSAPAPSRPSPLPD